MLVLPLGDFTIKLWVGVSSIPDTRSINVGDIIAA
jgi:hypothetical protein